MGRSKQEAQYMGAGKSSGASQGRVSFVSRRKPDSEELHDRSAAERAGLAPTIWERRTQLLLLFTALLQAFAWTQLHGYQLADSVEFMDRAFAVARGDTLDSTGAVRGFGFSTFLLPFFALARLFELEDMRQVVHVVRLLQMLFGLGLVYYCIRLGAHLGGRRAGYVAGFLVAINPIFMSYSVDPVSGIAAAFFVALGLNILVLRVNFRRSVVGGIAMGAAFMMAYQTILIGAPLIVLLLLRGRARHTRTWFGALLGLTLALLAQVVLDKITYGTWGATIGAYLIENTGGVLFSLCHTLGLQDAEWVKEAYRDYLHTLNDTAVMSEEGQRGSLQSPYFYLHELHTMLVYPVLALGLLGLCRAWREINWMSSILVTLLVINVYAMSMKGSKSFRLWLPLLPMIAPLCAWGWSSLVRAEFKGPVASWRRISGPVVLVASLVLGVISLYEFNPRRYGAYWDAMDYVGTVAHEERLLAEASGERFEPQTIGSAYNWAVFCRGNSDVQVVKFQGHLDQWQGVSDAAKELVLQQMDELDWLIVHGTILHGSPLLAASINKRFEVVASIWDEDTNPAIRDVRVMRNISKGERRGSLPAGQRPKRLFDVIDDEDPIVYRDKWQLDVNLPEPILFLGRGENGREEHLQLLGFEYEQLPTTEFGWITYHWYSDTGFDNEYVFIDRVTSLDCPWSWQNNHVPCYGALPTTRWKAGSIVRESYILVPGNEPFLAEFNPMGGAYRRGDLLPTTLWIHVGSPPPLVSEHVLHPADNRTGLALDIANAVPWVLSGQLTPEHFVVSSDGLLRIGKFMLPVTERLRWPDDGGPGPDEEYELSLLRQAKDRLELLAQEAEAGSSAPGGSESPPAD